MTEAQYNTYKSAYSSKINITTASGEDQIAPKYPILNELCNLDGEFQVGSTIVKVLNDKIVSIVDSEETDPSEVDDETVTDSTAGVYVREIYAGGCCPLSDSETNQYQNSNPRKRLVTQYRVADVSVVTEDPFRPGFVLFIPTIQITANSKSQIRRCFLFICVWKCDNVTLAQNFDITVTHNAGSFGISNPLVVSSDMGPFTNRCKIDFLGGGSGPALSMPWFNLPAAFTMCVDEVDLVCTNSTPISPVDVEIHCD